MSSIVHYFLGAFCHKVAGIAESARNIAGSTGHGSECKSKQNRLFESRPLFQMGETFRFAVCAEKATEKMLVAAYKKPFVLLGKRTVFVLCFFFTAA